MSVLHTSRSPRASVRCAWPSTCAPWDIWGGDSLQIDRVDPLTGASLLATPVAWTNTELASGDWIPMQVAIEDWPGTAAPQAAHPISNATPVELVFQVQTDWAFPTDFTIDNVRLTTTCQ